MAMTSHPAAQPSSSRAPLQRSCPVQHDQVRVPLASTQMLDDPAAFYAGLREHGPVVPVHLDGDVPAWLVTGFQACKRVLRDGLLFSRDLSHWAVAQDELVPPDWPLAPHVAPMENMLFAQGEEHLRLRGAFTTAVSRIGSRRVGATVQAAADRLIDTFVDQGQADIVSQYAAPLPVAVLTSLFGFPKDKAETLQRVILTLLDGGQGAVEASAELDDMINDLVDRRRREPRGDIVTGLLNAGLTARETSSTVWLAINAGIGSVVAWTANSSELLARMEDTRTELRHGLLDIPAVMLEALWEHTPVQQVIGRVARADVDLEGQHVRRGDLLIVSLAGANLDHAHLSGNGRIARSAYTKDNASHWSFGGGAHECPVQPLANAIVEGGVGRLWTRLEDIHLTHPEKPTKWRPSIIVRIPDRIDVTFDPARARARSATLAPTGDR